MSDPDWWNMSRSEAYRLCREDRLAYLRHTLAITPKELRATVFKDTVSPHLSHAETVVADIEFNVFGDRDEA